MENYEEKEKKLDNVLKQLNSMSSKVAKMSKDVFLLGAEKNQLLREKEESETNFSILEKKYAELKLELEKINKDISLKFGNRTSFNKKIDELNQETETLIDEIDKWQT